ncbi:MAG: glycine cleavage system aminomethyltransferase GcvT [Rhodoglobus sp.]
MNDTRTLRRSPLHEIHVAAGSSFTDFGGWLMPVRYSSDLAEHHAVRSSAGIFDISHMGQIVVEGPDSAAFLDHALAGELSVVAINQAKYTLLLSVAGGIIDDLIVYRRALGSYLVVANAGNRATVVDELTRRASGFEVTVTDASADRALIAVQGPRSRDILAATAGIAELTGHGSQPPSARSPLEQLKYYWSTTASFQGTPVLIARTGYTGEDGFELSIRKDAAASLWAALSTAGEPFALVPAGLASRDTLRLEAGMPLYGHELGLDTFAVQAGLARVVALTKPGDFVGRRACELGPPASARVLVGLVSAGRRAGRAGYPVLDSDTQRGVVTSGALSPTLGYPIAMAYVDPAVSAVGTELAIDVRGSIVAASVVSLPFVTRKA